VLLIFPDNTAAANWASALSFMMENNQNPIAIYAQPLCRTTIGINTQHIPWITNIMADFLSCLDLSLLWSSCLAQIFWQYSFLQNWPYFRPSRMFLRLLTSSLYSTRWPVPPILPAKVVVNMKWMDDLTGATLPCRRLSLQVVLYAMHLGNGGSHLCCMIKAGTNAKYLQAVENFLQHLHPM
jgi:hypothetical protein